MGNNKCDGIVDIFVGGRAEKKAKFTGQLFYEVFWVLVISNDEI